jgi:hypothetical protein
MLNGHTVNGFNFSKRENELKKKRLGGCERSERSKRHKNSSCAININPKIPNHHFRLPCCSPGIVTFMENIP